jgi:eukaryotic-like serine/threonine-protein kinase
MSDASLPFAAALAARGYLLIRELGHGGMATVYLAEDQKHHRQVAVKVLRPELAASVGAERFLREIATTANLRHAHILPLFDSGEAAGYLFYVMPLVEGESLADRLAREKQLALDEALAIAGDVAGALSYAHAHGVVHRDIKPENILLENGDPVVTDFGIARAVSEAGAGRLTKTGMAVGTPLYMSPEQAAGESGIDGRSDQYSLACVLFHMLAGEPPFTGPNAIAITRQHLVADPPLLSHLRAGIPDSVTCALSTALRKLPGDRFATMDAFVEALRRSVGTASPVGSSRWRPALVVTLILVVVGGVVALILTRRWTRTAPLPSIGRTIQVTREPGLEVDPAISPDGQFVAYAAGPTTNMQIMVRQVSGGRTVQLTHDSAGNHRWPRWSPDGSQLAYQAIDGVYVMPALGGSPRLVARPPARSTTITGLAFSFTPLVGLAWSPDGKRLAVAVAADGLYLVSAQGGELIRLNAPPEPHSPAWSPDGTQIAVTSGNPIFVFGMVYFANVGASSLWLVPVDGGAPRQLTDRRAMEGSPQWEPGGRALYFVSDRGGGRDVYRLSLERGSQPERLTTGLDAQTITVSGNGARIGYARLQSSTNVWSAPVEPRGASTIPLAPVTTGQQTIEQVDVSRDGRWLVFDSNRNGNADLYKQRVAGGEAIQLTSDSTGEFSPVWSPDGTLIAFHRLVAGQRSLFTVSADGTGLRQVSHGARSLLDPSWQPDGKGLAAQHLDATGGGNLAILRLSGVDTTVRTLPIVGDFAEWSPDGGLIAYHTIDGIRVIEPNGDGARLLASNATDETEAFYSAWSPNGQTVYYLARGGAGWMIRAVPRTGGPSRVLWRFEDPARQPLGYGFATDGARFYFTLGSHESDLWVLDLKRR